MHKITNTEKKVLQRLIYPEKFTSILDETGLQYGELRDDLINLLNFGLVEAFEQKNKQISVTEFYDSDNLQLFSFRATSKGLAAI